MSRGPGAAQRELLDELASGPRAIAELPALFGRRRDLVARALEGLVRSGRVIVSEGRAALSGAPRRALTECATLTYERDGAAVYAGEWRSLLRCVDRADALIVDAPYSAKTHRGHDKGTRDVNASSGSRRRVLAYAAWGPADVAAFVRAWAPKTRGWFVSITDFDLAPAWCAALADAGRYVFTPLPFVAPGRSVRLQGDGPSCWTCWIVVARPRSSAFAQWGTLPGAYLPPVDGGEGRPRVVGGKPLWLLRALVRDYSRTSDLIVDPCCGAGTTLRASLELGRRAIGGDASESHAHLAAAWLADPMPEPIAAESYPEAAE